MKSRFNLITVIVCLFGSTIFINLNVFSQGNSNGNANSNNNANGNALKWETQGNNADTSHFIGTTNPTALKMRTNNQERMRITKDGKFGIGISNPLEKFEIQGNIRLTGDIIFSDYIDLNDSTGRFLFVDQNGRTIPKTLEQLKSDFYAAPIGDQPASLCHLGIIQQNPTWSNGPYKIYSLCPDVNVGIGTNDPQKLLDVRGTAQTRRLQVGRESSGYSLISGFRIGVSNTTILSLGNFNPQTQTEHKILELTSSGEFNLNYNSTHQGATNNIFTISNENRKLLYLNANNATLYARRIIVDQQTWADYVFTENYELLPLSQVKKYIDDNGHLPNVPSEKEVTQEGTDLAEMNRILLEKIEELTLYTIQQQEEIELLKQLIEQK